MKDGTDRELVQDIFVKVARLYYQDSLSQLKIAKRLGVSRSLVAQYLQHARESGIVQIKIVDLTNSCTDLEAALKKATGVNHVNVTPNPRGPEMLGLRAIAGNVAEFIVGRLKDGYTLGLAWGRTTMEVVDRLTHVFGAQINVLPLMGESGHSGLYSQMNQMVVNAAHRLQANPHFLSLPIVVSSPALRRSLLMENGIREVIMLWDHVNVACFGIGTLPPVPGMVAYMGDEHLPRLIKAGAVGDMCGVYFDRDGKIISTGIEDRTIAINLDQFKAIDYSIGVACGVNKTVAVLGALRTGLLSALFIDQAMAEQILRILNTNNRPNPK